MGDHLKIETARGTDQPWARPGNVAQNPAGKPPSPEQRQNEYEPAMGQAERSSYPREAPPSVVGGPVSATSNVNGEGRVGDPLPLLLVVLGLIPVGAAVAVLAWVYLS